MVKYKVPLNIPGVMIVMSVQTVYYVISIMVYITTLVFMVVQYLSGILNGSNTRAIEYVIIRG